jgi:hypothetical protein
MCWLSKLEAKRKQPSEKGQKAPFPGSERWTWSGQAGPGSDYVNKWIIFIKAHTEHTTVTSLGFHNKRNYSWLHFTEKEIEAQIRLRTAGK